MTEGWVYLITNEAMPGFVKIGLTKQNDVQSRLRQLDTTAVPLPFECHFAARVPDCAKLERTLHFVFGAARPRKGREFFRIDPDLAKAIIQLVAIDEEVPSLLDQTLDDQQRKDVQEARKRRENLSFRMLGVPVGAELAFEKDATKNCVVVGDKKVRYSGEVMSVSAAALKALGEMGYQWKSINGWAYWLFNGVRLSDRNPVNNAAAALREFDGLGSEE